MNTIRRISFAAAFAGAALLWTGCEKAGQQDQETSARSVLLPDAELVVYVNTRAISKSPFAKTMEEFSGKMAKAEPDKMKAAMKEHLGLEQNDFVDLAVSIDGLAAAKDKPENVNLSAGVLTAKPVSAEQVKNFLVAVASENNNDKVDPDKLKIVDRAGTKAILVPTADSAENATAEHPNFYIAPVPAGAGSLVVVSKEDGFDAAIARAKEGGSGELPTSIQRGLASLVGGPNAWVVGTIPESSRADLAEMTKQGPFAGTSKALGTLDTVSFGMDFTDVLGIQIVGLTGDEQAAAKVSANLEMLINGMLKPMLANSPDGEPEALKALAIGNEGAAFYLRTTVTTEEMKKLAEQGAGMAGAGMGN